MKDAKQILLDELSKESELVIATAYLYATTFVKYGGDITEAWTTATQQKAILEKAYNNGYSDALNKREESKLEKIKQIIKQVESLHPEIAIGDREGIRKIKEVLEQDN